MPAIHATGQDEEDIEVLVTGFGVSGEVEEETGTRGNEMLGFVPLG